MDTIRPSDISGFNAVGRVTGTTKDLEQMSFVSLCPPDVSPKTRIIAVCGVSDSNDEASPKADGWLLSDFYLFHHLFSPLNVPTSTQIWLTCEELERLVEKYTEYLHGDPKNERRVVLDRDCLPRVAQAKNLRVVPRADLLERFLSTLEEQSRLARDFDEHLLVLIFGHGDLDSHGVIIGTKAHSSSNIDQAPLLHIKHVKRRLRPNVPVTLFLTSCFSGGWLVQPCTNRETFLNTTGVAAAAPTKESSSWPLSRSIGRASGGTVATAIVQSLIDIEESDTEELEIRRHPTYISLATSVFYKLQQFGAFATEPNVHFAAQDDAWEAHYQRRLGFPLDRLKDRWESLRSIPPSGYLDTELAGSAGGTPRRFGSLNKRKKLISLGRLYLASYPGPNHASPNIGYHAQLRSLIDGTDSVPVHIDNLFNVVTYRLSILHQADEVARYLGLSIGSVFDYCVENWKVSYEKRAIRDRIFRLLVERRVFELPLQHEGYAYTKPFRFLAIALAESGLEWHEIEQKVRRAVELRSRRSRFLSHLWGGQRIIEDKGVLSYKRAFINAMKALGHRMKPSLSKQHSAS
jgi:hypothetical protein